MNCETGIKNSENPNQEFDRTSTGNCLNKNCDDFPLIHSKHKNSQFYENKLILAPMVRMNSLAFRLLALEYGADLVYSEELIDHRIVECRRIVNQENCTIDFLDSKDRLIFQTCHREHKNIVLQIGSNNPERALKAAKIFANDVAAIDFNFGCPQSFSLKGGMGAALLTEPEKIRSLLTTMIANIDKPVTCKIRVLPQLEDTIKLVKMIEQCGVSAIAVHGRTKREKTKHKNRNEFIRAITEVVNIPVIASGGSSDIKTFADVMEFKSDTGASSVMLARAAMANASIFQKPKIDPKSVPLPLDDVIRKFLCLTQRFTCHFANTKWSVQMMLGSRLNSPLGAKLLTSHEMCEIYQLFGVDYENNKDSASRGHEFESQSFGNQHPDDRGDESASQRKKLKLESSNSSNIKVCSENLQENNPNFDESREN